MAPCLPQCLSDLRTSFSHRHLWVIAGSIEPFPLREGDGASERGGRIMCRILDKLSGIPTGHSHCLWNLIRACHQLTFKKPSVPSIIVKSGQFWVNDPFIMMCVCVWDSVRRFDLQKRGDSRRFGLSSPPIQRE